MNLKKFPIEWLYDRCKNSRAILESNTFSRIFSSRCFVGGGLLRFLIRNKDASDVFWYFYSGGDVDVFCPDEEAATLVKAKFTRTWRRSRGDAAAESTQNFSVQDLKKFDDIFGKAPEFKIDHVCGGFIVQVVDSHYGPPDTIASRFDLVNVQVISDGESIWINPELIELEEKRVLKAAASTDLLGPRLLKYIKKYDYASIHPETITLLNDWIIKFSDILNSSGAIFKTGQNARRIIDANRVFSDIVLKDLLHEETLNFLKGKLHTIMKFYEYCDIDDDEDARNNVVVPSSCVVDPVDVLINRKKNVTLKSGDLVKLVSACTSNAKYYDKGIIIDPSLRGDKCKILLPDHVVVKTSRDIVAHVIGNFEDAI